MTTDHEKDYNELFSYLKEINESLELLSTSIHSFITYIEMKERNIPYKEFKELSRKNLDKLKENLEHTYNQHIEKYEKDEDSSSLT